KVGGLKPAVFNEILAEEYFLKVFNSVNVHGKHTTNHIEFGAKQIIIVRDDDDKEFVMKLVEEAAMVETVFNCKGMEFDVVLYNFFKNLSAHKKWRVIHSFLDKNEKGVPIFSYEKHSFYKRPRPLPNNLSNNYTEATIELLLSEKLTLLYEVNELEGIEESGPEIKLETPNNPTYKTETIFAKIISNLTEERHNTSFEQTLS
ncbi:23918_t:CDS:2, partial [Gigaspora rosea]